MKIVDKIVSEPLKDMSNAIDTWQKTDNLTNAKGVGYAAAYTLAKPFNDTMALNQIIGEKMWGGIKSLFTYNGPANNQNRPSFQGEVKISIDQDGTAKVKSLNSNNPDVTLDVDSGLVMQ